MMGSIKNTGRVLCLAFLAILMLSGLNPLFPQSAIQKNDTLHIKAGSRVEFLHSVRVFPNDTIIIVPQNSKYIISEPRDSTTNKFYQSIDTYSKKNKFLELIHNSIIVEKKPFKTQGRMASFNKSAEEYRAFSGKIIADIRFKQVRLFSGSIEDTTYLINQQKQGALERIHHDTKPAVIGKYLTFNRGDTLNPHDISDSERILRGLSFIEDANILVIPDKSDTNSVDIVVVTKDRFALGVNFIPHTAKRISAKFYDRNVLGNGWNFEAEYRYNKDFKNPNGTSLKINFINIYGKFIDAEAAYYHDEEREAGRLALSKPFVTVVTKYGGGVTLENVHSYLKRSDTLWIPYTDNYEDIWASRQVSVSQTDRNKTMFFAARAARKGFTNRPYISPDSNYFFYDENLALASVIYSKIDYYKSRLIYGFGITEDIPVGTRIGITGGIIYDDFYNYNYFGVNAGYSIIGAKLGYLLFGVKYGGLYQKTDFRHGAVYLYSKYISPLIKRGRVSFRQFLNIGFAEIYNRQRDYYLYLRDENGVRGLSLSSLRGTKRFTLSYEALMFSPFNVYGFRFVSYAFGDFAVIGDSYKSLFNNRLYSGIGLGWRIKNESLVFSTIQIRLAYYPQTVKGGSAFGFNVKTSDTRLFKNVFPVKPTILDLRKNN
jgi:hypothetical protein